MAGAPGAAETRTGRASASRRSSAYTVARHKPALVAQWIEHLTTDQAVGSSTLSERAGHRGALLNGGSLERFSGRSSFAAGRLRTHAAILVTPGPSALLPAPLPAHGVGYRDAQSGPDSGFGTTRTRRSRRWTDFDVRPFSAARDRRGDHVSGSPREEESCASQHWSEGSPQHWPRWSWYSHRRGRSGGPGDTPGSSIYRSSHRPANRERCPDLIGPFVEVSDPAVTCVEPIAVVDGAYADIPGVDSVPIPSTDDRSTWCRSRGRHRGQSR